MAVDASDVEEMFVQQAAGMTRQGDTMSLVRVAASTLYFSNRPQRVVGHMTTEQFVGLWGEGTDSFQAGFLVSGLLLLGSSLLGFALPRAQGPGFRPMKR